MELNTEKNNIYLRLFHCHINKINLVYRIISFNDICSLTKYSVYAWCSSNLLLYRKIHLCLLLFRCLANIYCKFIKWSASIAILLLCWKIPLLGPLLSQFIPIHIFALYFSQVQFKLPSLCVVNALVSWSLFCFSTRDLALIILL